ncbi:MAG: hypothetical protein RIR53_172 [Bacteroidota bacterium]|jgi:hypothetical protein
MIQRIAAAFLILAVLTSCEVPIEVELPHTERLVVDGFIGLEPESSELRVLRTLPPLAKVDVSAMIVPGLSASIEWKGTSYPLAVNADSSTFVLPPDAPSWDDGIARLVVRGAGKSAAAQTRIPKRPLVVSHRVIDSLTSWGSAARMVVVDLEVDTGTVVWATGGLRFLFFDSRPMSNYGLKEIAPSTGNNGRTVMRLVASSWDPYSVPDSVTISITSADAIYDRYLRSPYGGGDGLFGFSGVNPWFNVQGDGIGLFIGASSTKIKVGLR